MGELVALPASAGATGECPRFTEEQLAAEKAGMGERLFARDLIVSGEEGCTFRLPHHFKALALCRCDSVIGKRLPPCITNQAAGLTALGGA
jgi:hypothetical protein